MKNKLPCLLLAGAIAFSLAACAPSGEIPSPSPSRSSEAPSIPLSSAQPETPSPSPSQPPAEPSPDPVELTFSLPDWEYQPWQEGYIDFLADLMAQEWSDILAYESLSEEERWTEEGEALMAFRSTDYSLYDIDQDGVPEIFVTYNMGTLKRCYTFRDGEVVLVGEFPSSHGTLYTCPGESAFLIFFHGMGYANLWKYPMEDGRLGDEQVLFTENDVPEFTEPYEFVPGAERIDYFTTQRGEPVPGPDDPPRPSAGKAPLLPVCDWYDGPPATGNSSEGARTAIQAVLNGESFLYGAPVSNCFGDTGWVTWEEYIQPGMAYPYNEKPFRIKEHVWQDLNGDGQEECILHLEIERDGTKWLDEGTVVLSEQGGLVYAYYLSFFDAYHLHSDGTFRSNIREDGLDRALSFWQEQCYHYIVYPSADAQPVEWQEGAPDAGPGESVDLVG